MFYMYTVIIINTTYYTFLSTNWALQLISFGSTEYDKTVLSGTLTMDTLCSSWLFLLVAICITPSVDLRESQKNWTWESYYIL